MDKEYSQFLIKDFKYWTLNIHENQGYLGRCVLYCKREDALDLPEATVAEQKEFFKIISKVKEALTTTFQPDWFNWNFRGNGTQHLHCHIIPRYATPHSFEGMTFEDTRWGHSHRTDHSFVTTPELLEKIKAKIKTVLN